MSFNRDFIKIRNYNQWYSRPRFIQFGTALVEPAVAFVTAKPLNSGFTIDGSVCLGGGCLSTDVTDPIGTSACSGNVCIAGGLGGISWYKAAFHSFSSGTSGDTPSSASGWCILVSGLSLHQRNWTCNSVPLLLWEFTLAQFSNRHSIMHT